MTPNERCIVVEPHIAPPTPPPPPRWHSRWGLLIAFQAGMIGVLALRHAAPDPEEPRLTRAEPVLVPAVVVATTPTPAPPPAPAATPASTPRPARTSAARARPAAAVVEPGRLVEVELVSDPPGATVRIGDQVGGTTPLAAYLPSSTTTIRFELDGYAAYSTRWSPRAGKRVAAVLKPAL